MMSIQDQGRDTYRMGGITYQYDAAIVPTGNWIVNVKRPTFDVR